MHQRFVERRDGPLVSHHENYIDQAHFQNY